MNPSVGFQVDKRTRKQLERDGYKYMETITAPFSAGDDLMIKVEMYMKGDEMVMKLLETPDLKKMMKQIEKESL